MKINGSTALVTGANRGLGLAPVQALQRAGCGKIYAASRRGERLAQATLITPVQLDINNMEHVAAAAARCDDVNLPSTMPAPPNSCRS